ncbi:MAG: hypothetical protein HY747_00775 [Elusimicrobia bacterium]|nr:hypothetical protein [Elusimicrobiota bacterium]
MASNVFGSWHLNPEERQICERISTTGLSEWKNPDFSYISTPSSNVQQYPFLLPLVFIVYNHNGHEDSPIDEREIDFYIEQSRYAFRPCGIEVSVESIRYVQGPSFLDSLDCHPDANFVGLISEKELCLYGAVHQPDFINIYFVKKVPAGENPDGQSYALNRRAFEYARNVTLDMEQFIGSIIIVDSDRINLSVFNPNEREQVGVEVVPHEIGHIILNQGHEYGFLENLMSDTGYEITLSLTPEQCRKALDSPFVHRRYFLIEE